MQTLLKNTVRRLVVALISICLFSVPFAFAQSEECQAAKAAFEEAHDTFKTTHKAAREAKKEGIRDTIKSFRAGDITAEEKDATLEGIVAVYESVVAEAEANKDLAEEAKDAVCEQDDDEDGDEEEE